MNPINSWSKNSASRFVAEMQHVAFVDRKVDKKYVAINTNRCSSHTTNKTAAVSFKTLVSIADTLQHANLLTASQKFDLGISLHVITEHFKQKPPQWYHRLPIFSCIYSYQKQSQQAAATKVVQELLAGYSVSKNRSEAAFHATSLKPGSFTIWPEGEKWFFFQKRPFNAPIWNPLEDSCFITSHKDCVDLTSLENAKTYYMSKGIFQSRKHSESKEAFLMRHASYGIPLLIQGADASELRLFTRVPSCDGNRWVKQTLTKSDNVHERVQALLDAHQDKNACLKLLEKAGLYDPKMRRMEDNDFSKLGNREYTIIRDEQPNLLRPKLYFIQRVLINGKPDLRWHELSKANILHEITTLINQTDAYCEKERQEKERQEKEQQEKKLETQFFHPQYTHIPPDIINMLFEALFSEGLHDAAFTSAPLGRAANNKKTPQEKLMGAKANVLKILDPTQDAAKVSFYEMFKKRKMWFTANHQDRGGDQEKVKQLTTLWAKFEKKVQKYFQNASMSTELMKALDEKYYSQLKKTL